jgi:hypothetical protein
MYQKTSVRHCAPFPYSGPPLYVWLPQWPLASGPFWNTPPTLKLQELAGARPVALQDLLAVVVLPTPSIVEHCAFVGAAATSTEQKSLELPRAGAGNEVEHV